MSGLSDLLLRRTLAMSGPSDLLLSKPLAMLDPLGSPAKRYTDP